MLAIVGTASEAGNSQDSPDDDVVPNASSTFACEFLTCVGIPRDQHVRYVPYKHASITFLPPSAGRALVFVDAADHQTLKLVEDFISEKALEVTFAVPALPYTQNGLVLIEFSEAAASAPVSPGPIKNVLVDGSPFPLTLNVDSGALTLWPIAEGEHVIEVQLKSSKYVQPQALPIKVTGGRPTVVSIPLQRGN
jgi:hypothetical protein